MFAHLHVHTEYSLLDGMGKIKDIVKKVKESGMTACAITDHGVGSGLPDFYAECKSQEKNRYWDVSSMKHLAAGLRRNPRMMKKIIII